MADLYACLLSISLKWQTNHEFYQEPKYCVSKQIIQLQSELSKKYYTCEVCSPALVDICLTRIFTQLYQWYFSPYLTHLCFLQSTVHIYFILKSAKMVFQTKDGSSRSFDSPKLSAIHSYWVQSYSKSRQTIQISHSNHDSLSKTNSKHINIQLRLAGVVDPIDV